MAVIRPLFQPDPFPTVIYCFYTGQLYKWVLGGVDVKRQGLGLFRVQHYDEVPVNYQLLDCSALPAVVLQPPL